ncbi:MAG TPA: hypothetical protein VMR96_07570 [Solirubrobacterales bacterium]|nr:hypothetical protein [Solirubrobacterales bacterium]
MAKGMIVAVAAALVMSGPAQAAGPIRNGVEIDRPGDRQLNAEVVEVQSSRRPAGAIVLTDAIGGAVVGTAVGGGVALYRRFVENGSNGQWGNWQRDLALGAAIGLGAGLIVGVIDASANAADRAPVRGAVVDERPSGFNAPIAVHGGRF